MLLFAKSSISRVGRRQLFFCLCLYSQNTEDQLGSQRGDIGLMSLSHEHLICCLSLAISIIGDPTCLHDTRCLSVVIPSYNLHFDSYDITGPMSTLSKAPESTYFDLDENSVWVSTLPAATTSLNDLSEKYRKVQAKCKKSERCCKCRGRSFITQAIQSSAGSVVMLM